MAKKISTTRKAIAPRVPQMMPFAQVGWQIAARQGNHYSIVATQQDVDHHDLAHSEPEFRGQ